MDAEWALIMMGITEQTLDLSAGLIQYTDWAKCTVGVEAV